MWLDVPLHQYLPYLDKKLIVDEVSLLCALIFIPIVLLVKNSNFYMDKKVSFKMLIISSLAFSYAIVSSFFTSTAVFLLAV